MYKYNAIVKYVIDANTVELTVDVGFGLTYRRIMKIEGANFPAGEEDGAREFKSKAIALLLNKRCVIQSNKQGRFGRYTIDLFINDENYLNQIGKM